MKVLIGFGVSYIVVQHTLYITRNGYVTGVKYRDEIMVCIIRPYFGTIGDGFMLVDDNNRPHRTRIVNGYQ